MNSLFKKYKAVIQFVVLFLGAYFVLSVLYSVYLNFALTTTYYPDFVTNLVAQQSSWVLKGFGYSMDLFQNTLNSSVYMQLENNYGVNIVEGCNSVSIIILFASFIIAFAERFKKTILFLFAGATLIYAVNIARIAILVVALHKYPQYESILHGVVFPGIIYSMVFLLWMIWVRSLKPKSINV